MSSLFFVSQVLYHMSEAPAGSHDKLDAWLRERNMLAPPELVFTLINFPLSWCDTVYKEKLGVFFGKYDMEGIILQSTLPLDVRGCSYLPLQVSRLHEE